MRCTSKTKETLSFRPSLVTVRPVLRSMADLPAVAPAPLLEQGAEIAAGQMDAGQAGRAKAEEATRVSI